MANGDMVETYTLSGTDDGGVAYSISNSDTDASVVRIQKQRVPLTTTQVVLMEKNATEDGDAFSDIDKIVIRNLDATDSVIVGRETAAGDCIYELLPAGKFLVINNLSIDAAVAGPISPSVADFTSLVAEASANTPDIEILIYRT